MMRSSGMARAAGLMMGLIPLALGGEVMISEDRMLTIQGKPAFVLGLYENPQEENVLDQVAQAGFNLVQSPADSVQLDRLHKRGLYAWVNVGSAIDLSESRPQREAQLKDLAEKVASHPGLLAWEVPDEALWNCWYSASQWRMSYEPEELGQALDALGNQTLAEELRSQMGVSRGLFAEGRFADAETRADAIWRKLGKEPPKPGLNLSNAPDRAKAMGAGISEGYKLLKQVDPHHPIWMNHAPRNQIEQLAWFNRGADVVGCDIYPVPEYRTGHSDLADRSLASVGAYTDRMQAAGPGKPVWMVLQGFGWADLDKNADDKAKTEKRRPFFDESRFMAYDAIVHGARGILYWGTAYIEKDSELWQDLLRVVEELASLQSVLAAPDANTPIQVTVSESWGSLDQTVRVLGKDVQGGPWWIVVNESHDPLQYAMKGLGGLEGQTYVEATAGIEALVKDGTLSLPIKGQGVHVLRPRKANVAAQP